MMDFTFTIDGITIKVSVSKDDSWCETKVIEPTYRVVLDKRGDKMIQVIRAIRLHTGCGFKEAKELSESAPVELISGSSHLDALALYNALSMGGAESSIFPE